MPYLLAIDQGTSSSRAIVFDHQGHKAAVAQREFAQHFPQPGWVEHDADAIWSSVLDTTRQALAEARLSARDITAIGITNQRETIVLWDRATGKPLHRAIVWQDRRTAGMLDRLRAAGHERAVRKKTGLFLDPYFSGSKLRWLLDNVPGARAAAKAGRLAAGTIDAWLVYKLTGGKAHLTDASNASRTLLMNIHTGAWDPALLKLFGIPASVLPEIRPNSGRLAETDPTLFGTRIPIAGIVGDQQAALFGQLCIRAGLAKCTYGTGCFLLMFTGTRAITSRNRLLTTVAWQIGDGPMTYALEGSVFVGGAAIQWLRDGLHLIATAPEVNELAAKVPDSGGVVVVPAFTGLGAPYWDANARGAIVGITRGTTSAHLARATLEAIAFEVGDLVEAMQRDVAARLRELRVDGGAAASDLLMQMQADQLGVRVARPANLETTALGAAYMAGLAVGVWPNLRALAGEQRLDRTFTPQMRAPERAAQRARWQRAVERAKGWQEE
ncbi:MAG: glycerol kinase GlpK [Burkholderiales bacterium]